MPGPSLFFINSKEIINNQIIITAALLRHIKVLRLGKGDRMWVGDERRRRYFIELTDIDKKMAVGRILETKESSNLSSVEIIMVQSILKGEKMDQLIQKSTELGAARIIPVISERTIVKIKEGAAGKEERWQRIAKEASQQCGRWDIPRVGPLRRFEDAFNDIKDVALALILWEGEHINKLRDILRGRAQAGIKNICLLVGPEGGFTREEVKFAMEKGFIPVSLGDLILRAETAAITIISVVQYEFGNIG